MQIRANPLRLSAVLAALVLAASVPRGAAATPGPVDRKPLVSRAGVVPRDLLGGGPDAVLRLALPADFVYAASTRGALLPRAGVSYLVALEQGAGPALQPAWLAPTVVLDADGVSADEIPLDNVTRGAVMPLPAGEPGAWQGEGVGPTGTGR